MRERMCFNSVIHRRKNGLTVGESKECVFFGWLKTKLGWTFLEGTKKIIIFAALMDS